MALVIGNSNYDYAGLLPNPVNDAQAMGDILRELGFEVYLGLDMNKDETDQFLREFGRALDGADVGLFFYAGHGLQVDGINYMVPTDAALERVSDLDFEVIDTDIVLRQFDRPDFTGLVFLDACRNNPLASNLTSSTRSIGRGLAEVQSATGTLVAYATQPGNVAYDGDGEHSPFTTALLSHIATPGLEVRLMFDLVGEDVSELTNGLQQPWVHFSRMRGGFYFKPGPAAETVETGNGSETGDPGDRFVANENDPAVRFYEYARTLESEQERLLMLEQFIRLYPTHPLAVLAATDVQDLRASAERAANPNQDRTDPTPGRENTPPAVEPARTLTLDADAGPIPLAIVAPDDEDGDDLTVTLIELPTAGTVRSVDVPVSVGDVITPGELTGLDYRPDASAEGAVGAVRYRVEDGNGGTTEGLVRISLRAPNRPPLVQEVASLALEQADEPVPLNIIAPIDPDNDRLMIRVTWLPRAGLVELNGRPVARGEELTAFQLIALTYRTDPERVGDMGSFEYEVDDGRGGLIRATVRIGVARPNNPPLVGEAERVELGVDPAGVPLGIALPSDPDGDTLTIRISWTPRLGAIMNGDAPVERGDELSLAEFAALRYVASAGNDGDAGSFEYTVSDGRGEPARGMVRISVTAPNAAPEVVADQAVSVKAEDRAAVLDFRRPVDPDGDALTVGITEIPFRGRLTAGGRTLRVGDTIDDAALDRLVYEPAAGHIGAAGQLAMTVTDGETDAQAAVVRISVESSNRAPIAEAGGAVWVVPGVLTPLGVAAPTDPDGDPLTIRVLRVPDGGLLRLGSTVLRAGQTLAPAQLASIGFEMTGATLDGAVFAYEADDGRGGLVAGSVSLFAEEIAVITAPPGEDIAGSDEATAYDLGPIDGRTLIVEDTIDDVDIDDVFRFGLSDWTQLSFTLTGLEGDLDLIVTSLDLSPVGSSERVGDVDEDVTGNVPPGEYLVRISGYDSAVSGYQLTVSARTGTPTSPDAVGNELETASMLGALGSEPFISAERIDLLDAEDWYGFDIAGFTEVSAQMYGLTNDLDLELLDEAGIPVMSSTETGTNAEAILITLEAGRYYVRVYAYGGQSDYELAIEGLPVDPSTLPPDNAGNSLEQAAWLGAVQGSLGFGDWIGFADKDDFIEFEITVSGELRVTLSGMAGDADLELLAPDGSLIAVSNNSDIVDEEIVVDVAPGYYIAHVYRFSGETDYRLDIALATGGVAADPNSANANSGQGSNPNPPEMTLAERQAWEGSWSREERMEVQRALQLLGYYNSGIDGVLGSGSRRGITEFQAQYGLPVTGYLSYYDRALLALGAAEEAAQRAEAAAEAARNAAIAPNAEEDISDGGNVYLGDRNRQGYGTYDWADGHRFEGQWNITRQGFGVLTLANGWRFAGQWDDSVFIGFGIAEGTDGAFMAGEWNVPRGTALTDGLNGFGQIIAAGGDEQFGYFADSVLQPWGGGH